MFYCQRCNQEQADIHEYWRHWQANHIRIRQPDEVRNWRINGIIPDPHQPHQAEADPNVNGQMTEEDAVPEANPNVDGQMPEGLSRLQRRIWQAIVDRMDEERQKMERSRLDFTGYALTLINEGLAELQTARNAFSIIPVPHDPIPVDNGIPAGLSPLQRHIWQLSVDLIEKERQKMQFIRLQSNGWFLASLNTELDELETIRNSFRIN
jgi:hypothetical protein